MLVVDTFSHLTLLRAVNIDQVLQDSTVTQIVLGGLTACYCYKFLVVYVCQKL